MKGLASLIRDAAQRDSFWVERAIIEFTSELHTEMKRQGKSYSDFARILETSPAYVTKVFRGNANFTIQSMVKLSRALGCRLHLKVAHEDAKVTWFHMPPAEDRQAPPGYQADNYKKVAVYRHKEVISDARSACAA